MISILIGNGAVLRNGELETAAVEMKALLSFCLLSVPVDLTLQQQIRLSTRKVWCGRAGIGIARLAGKGARTFR
jgi:hypothetical protein